MVLQMRAGAVWCNEHRLRPSPGNAATLHPLLPRLRCTAGSPLETTPLSNSEAMGARGGRRGRVAHGGGALSGRADPTPSELWEIGVGSGLLGGRLHTPTKHALAWVGLWSGVSGLLFPSHAPARSCRLRRGSPATLARPTTDVLVTDHGGATSCRWRGALPGSTCRLLSTSCRMWSGGKTGVVCVHDS